ncbi:P-loop containing nucleoside triphosphate hydrolase protein [Aspergillus venezuelensis]
MASRALDDYTAAAARVMLDKTHSQPQHIGDSNAYQFGELNGHHIVIAHLPNGIYGTVSAASVASRMRLTFRRLQVGLMVGIGGGVPSRSNDIRLGDVVVSKPGAEHGGVVQYDYGKAVQGGQFKPTGIRLEAEQMIGGEDAILKTISDILEQNPYMKEKFSPPEQYTDLLYKSSYYHADEAPDCAECDKEQLVQRQLRDTRTPRIHYGLIASGDRHGILCFEMEAAGLMNELPTLQKQWQGYAALTAAVYTKLLLSVIPACYGNTNSLGNKTVRHWIVPLPKNSKFVGRQSEITELEELFALQDGPRRVAITGLGGIGKTQVALELAYRIRDRDQERSVFWVPCTSHAVVEQTYLKIAQTLGIHDINPAEVKEQVKQYLSSDRAERWLLIFDNADDSEMWLATSDTAPPLEDFIPESKQGHVLFTTRNRKLAMKLAPFNLVPIPDVDKNTGFQILQQALARENLLQDNEAATSLLELLAFLPLAITQASAYIIENGISLPAYASLLEAQEQDAVELLSEDFRDPGRYKDIQNPIITTWLISFNRIRHQNQSAADYLSFMACINPRNIPQRLLPSQISEKQKIDALGLLNAYSFTSNQDAGINMHRLVQIATRNWLRKNGLFSHWVQRVADRIQEVFPDNYYTNRGIWRDYLPHALAVVHEEEFGVKEGYNRRLVQNIADCLASDGRYYEAEPLYRELLGWNQEKNGREHPDTMDSMANLASTYRNQGRWNEAEELQVQVMETSKTGRWSEAEKLEVQVMETLKTVLGDKHPNTLNSMANLASTYQHQGRWNEAEKLELQVMETSKTALGAEHPDTLSSMNSLAHTWHSQQRIHDALALMAKCLMLRKKVLGSSHPDSIYSSRSLKDWKEQADKHPRLPGQAENKFNLYNLPGFALDVK